MGPVAERRAVRRVVRGSGGPGVISAWTATLVSPKGAVTICNYIVTQSHVTMECR
ncbi:hypothetical protein GCM10017600_89170 [Streptosporangium carneum]|uniref:Uncharacterized protein n=1 Tax=Streptosporangium carneum TaxID=47481 RepID=A0A9W6IDH1_9ACTN|nr:hypothetical protein GCM10017600_89170 [Streptosporangium carneum]